VARLVDVIALKDMHNDTSIDLHNSFKTVPTFFADLYVRVKSYISFGEWVSEGRLWSPLQPITEYSQSRPTALSLTVNKLAMWIAHSSGEF
jgi:hypothetical protein